MTTFAGQLAFGTGHATVTPCHEESSTRDLEQTGMLVAMTRIDLTHAINNARHLVGTRGTLVDDFGFRYLRCTMQRAAFEAPVVNDQGEHRCEYTIMYRQAARPAGFEGGD